MNDDTEILTQRIGRELFALSNARGRNGASEPWWDRWMMSVAMRDERLKAQLFRFVDVLPVLDSPARITRHLREYLASVRDRLPGFAGEGLGLLPQDGRAAGDGGWLEWLVACATRGGAGRLARRFVAATDVADAVAAVTKMRRRSLAFTIDVLGEAVLSESEAKQYQATYLRLIDALDTSLRELPVIDPLDRDQLGGVVPRVNVSVKLSSLFSQFDPIDPIGTSRAVRQRLRPILRLARERGAFVNVDMEQHAYKDVTLRIFREILDEDEFRGWSDAGVAIQAYLRDSGDDLRALARWAEHRGTPVWVRLVKGAYWDYESVVAAQNDWPLPVFDHKAETDSNYESLSAFLIDRRDVLRPAIASHNIRSIAHALALAEQHDLPPRAIEFQMLYGMADPIKAALASRGQRVRVYMPIGQLLPGMAYLVRRLLENTSNESFLRAGFVEHVPEEQLLMSPTEVLRRSPPAPPRPRETFVNEPVTDFSRDQSRVAMEEALNFVRSKLGAYHPPIISGQRLKTGAWIESSNPSHRFQLVGRCGRATVQPANDAIAAAKRAFPAWRDTSPDVRAQTLVQAARLMRRRRFELAAWEVYETGKPWREADADVAEAIDYCDYYAGQMLRLAHHPHRRDLPGEENETFVEPRGVAVVIAPWNFPLAILTGMTTAALVTGNTVVMKPAEQSSVIGAMLMEILEAAGFPAGVINYLPGVGEEIGPTLVNHRDVATIAFTGSRTVGLSIQHDASRTPAGQEHVKGVITEMGGKNAIIVDDDADLDEAVHGVVASAFGYAGQKCSACSRAIVLDAVHDTFLSRLVEAARSLRVGPAEDPATFVGPVIDDEARRRILDYIEAGKHEARLVCCNEIGQLAQEGTYVPPHIFTDVPPDATIAQEEIFGPVLSVIAARDLTHAIDIANGVQYALTGGVYSRSPANIERVRREFRVGNLYINRKITGALIDRQPFGGFKLSGTGIKAGGPKYLRQFVVERTITENTLRHGFAPTALAELPASDAI